MDGQRIIAYIEANLYDDLTLDELATYANYSKYYFQKQFVKLFGKSPSEYIKERRLANASSFLLFSSMRILEISLLCGFHSQEAFTRAFKERFGLPPKQYRIQISAWKKRGELMTEERKQTKLSGWLVSGYNFEKFQMTLETNVVHQGRQSLKIGSVEEAIDLKEDFLTVMQQFQAVDYLGKRVRFGGFIKTALTEGQAALWMRIDGDQWRQLKFDNMEDRPITGQTEWTYYYSVLDVPLDAQVINIGVFLRGKGEMWADSFSFSEVDRHTPTTDFSFATLYEKEPMNLSFED